jgi:hypothetical protein
MKHLPKALKDLGQNNRVAVGALLTAGALGGWALSATFTPSASALESFSRNANIHAIDESKPNLVGSYVVSGTDSDGRAYAGTSIVDISLAPSGALELEWDNGKQVGVGQVIGNVLAVSSLSRGRSSILLMTINSDGSLSGKWSRRTDRGAKGTEIWKKS